MSRFFIASDSDDYEEEEQNNEEEELEKENELKDDEPAKQKPKVSRFFDDSWKTDEKRTVRSEKSKRWEELSNNINAVNDELAYEHWEEAFKCFQKLTKATEKSSKAIAENGYPNFFIRGMKDMYETIKEKVDTVKQLKRFNAELEKFIKPFDDLLKQCLQNPEDFAELEEEEDDGLGFGNIQSESESSDSSVDDGPGRWFMSSDSEDESKKKKDEEKKEKKDKKLTKHSDKDYAEMIEERLKEAKNELITDATAKQEIEKIIAARNKGKIITSTDRLSVLLHSVSDKELKHTIQLEICYSIIQGQSDLAIPLEDWKLALNIIPELTGDAEQVVPLFERLNRDFWARSVEPRILFTPETTKLHTFLTDFLQQMIKFTDILEKDNKNNFCARLQILILEHKYHEMAPSYEERMKKRSSMSQQEIAEEERLQNEGLQARTPRELCKSILLKVPPEGLFDPQTSLSLRVRAMLYYAIHLAYNGLPNQAKELVEVLPEIPQDLPLVRILYNRAHAEIGIAAFMTGNYRLCYNSLKNFFRIGEENPLKTIRIQKLLGQQPRIYAPWLYIDSNALETYHYLSVMLLDIPCLTTFNFDDSQIVINPKLHKDLQKRVGITVCPETILDKVAVAIERCKRGEWKLALDILHYEIERYIERPEGFIRDVKLISLCAYLLTANQFYDAVQIETLLKHFELEPTQENEQNDVDACLRLLLKGRSPIGNVPLVFNGQVESGYVSFIHAEKESPLEGFQKTLTAKSDAVYKNLESLKSDLFK